MLLNRVLGFGFRVKGLGFRVQGFGFRVQGFGFRALGLGLRFVVVQPSDLLRLPAAGTGFAFRLGGKCCEAPAQG